MTVYEAYSDAVDAYSDLVEKFGAYTKASSYDGKKDFGKWLGELDKATKQVEAAYSESKTKTATLEKTLDDYLKENKDKIKDDKAKRDAVQAADDGVTSMKKGLQNIRDHLDEYKV